MTRFVAMIFVIIAGLIIIIPFKMLIDSLMGATQSWAGFSSLEVALIGVFPIIFLVFVVFVRPAIRFLSGKSPTEDERDKRR